MQTKDKPLLILKNHKKFVFYCPKHFKWQGAPGVTFVTVFPV